MRIVCIADQHGQLPKIEQSDLLLIAGDACPTGQPIQDGHWLKKNFNAWLKTVPAKDIVMVSGNHDWIFTPKFKHICPKLNCTYLQDEEIVINGVKIYGSPWTTMFNNWAFMLSDDELKEKWDKIPIDTDILLLHGPAYGIGDVPSSRPFINCGSKTLLNRIYQIKPRLVVFGHIHASYGIYAVDMKNDIGNRVIEEIKVDILNIPKNSDKIYFINASILNDEYQLTNKQIEVEFE
jgi:Icc-related predicted phosphoesterase